MLTKENPFIQSASEIFRNPTSSNRYEVSLKIASDVIENPRNLVVKEITMEASSLVDEKGITLLPVIQAFMQRYFENYDLMESDLVDNNLILTYGVVDFNYYDSLSELISDELNTIHQPLIRMVEDNVLNIVKLTFEIESY